MDTGIGGAGYLQFAPVRTRPTRWLASVASALVLSPGLGAQEEVSRIAFGSCFKTELDAEVFASIEAWDPEVFMMIGDNVYADTEDMGQLRQRYADLAGIDTFASLRGGRTFLATWDDHDYGRNDAGADYPQREASQQVFLDFLGEPADSERRGRAGVYSARSFGPAGSRLQVILLDTRYFRSPLDRREAKVEPALGRPGHYRPSFDVERTMLGEEQWAWLGERLREPADLRLLVSSIQVLPEDHGYETWANLPLERSRLMELIRDTKAGGVVLLSGDRHKAELSRLEIDRAAPDSAVDVGYAIHELTSSSLNAPLSWYNERNRHRIGSEIRQANFGTIEVAWSLPDPRITLRIHGDDGTTLLRHDLRLSELQP